MDLHTLLDTKESAAMEKLLLHQIPKWINTSNKSIRVQRERSWIFGLCMYVIVQTFHN